MLRRALLPSPLLAEQCMVMPAIRRRWTPADVRMLMQESRPWPRYELIAGELLVTPAPGSAHQIAVIELLAVLSAYLERQPVGLALISPANLELRPGTIAQPDLFVVPATTTTRGEQLRWSDIRALLLAVEVLSPGTARTDRVEKRDFYLDAAVAEYWIVDLDACVIERWTRERTTPELHRDTLVWQPGASRPLTLNVAALFARIARKLAMFRRG